ncbi:MAG: alpha/beta fold hydrolase [Acidobacteria bacterium]|jgi:pimeloyl-ACP methyl ester carboxylesterase|nr:MAG: alpha/beta fold hydrolase [Acidobacteriota bacterium]GIU81135.1 MAG: 3-oxoadipate enol-lactonase [Pyrinomonadaceae bacterium]
MLYFEKLGTDSKNVCVFLHAFPLDREMWQPQVEALKEKMQVILIDLPGFGKSLPIKNLSMEFMASEVIRTLDSLKIEKAIFVGLSMGGYVIFNLYRLFPQRVSAMVLCDTTPASDSEERKSMRFELIEQIKSQGVEVLAQQMLPNLVSKHTALNNTLLMEWLRQKFLNVNPEAAVSALKAMADRKDHTEWISNINVPTLLIFGEEDKVTNIEMAEKMNSVIANSSLVRIANAGHYSNLENPEGFNSALIGFIERHFPNDK